MVQLQQRTAQEIYEVVGFGNHKHYTFTGGKSITYAVNEYSTLTIVNKADYRHSELVSLFETKLSGGPASACSVRKRRHAPMRTVKSLIVLWRTFIPGLRRARTRKRSVKGGTLNIPSVLWSRKQRTEIGKALRRE